jgi:hypothetical protein
MAFTESKQFDALDREKKKPVCGDVIRSFFEKYWSDRKGFLGCCRANSLFVRKMDDS